MTDSLINIYKNSIPINRPASEHLPDLPLSHVNIISPKGRSIFKNVAKISFIFVLRNRLFKGYTDITYSYFQG